MQKKNSKIFDIFTNILNQPQIGRICQYIRWASQILKARTRVMLLQGLQSSVGTSDPIFNLTWRVELNFKFFLVKALKPFQLSTRVGSKQQFWHQLFSTRVIFKFKKINFFQVNSRKSWKNLNFMKWAFFAPFMK